MWLRRPRKSFGQRGEDAAARALRKAGYRILERNVRIGRREIDIIAQDGDTIAFTEVKTRRPGQAAAPEDSIGPTKRRHIESVARQYIARQDNPEQYYRFDVVSVVMPETGKPQTTIYRDAFRP